MVISKQKLKPKKFSVEENLVDEMSLGIVNVLN